MEKRIRTLSKTSSWRIVATSTTVVLVFLISNNLVLSATVGSLDALVKTIVYYFHERAWNASNFGRENLAADFVHKEKTA